MVAFATQADYRDQLIALLPPGAAWSAEPGSTRWRFLDALAAEFARVDGRMGDLLEESDPRTAVELLGEWATLTGEPDPCEGPSPTAAAMRARAIRVLTGRGGQSIPYLVSLASSLGYAISIREHRCSRAGEAQAGDEAAPPNVPFHFHVDAPPEITVEAIAGEARAGEPLWWRGAARLECALRRAKPAHARIHFTYGRALDWGWVGNPIEFADDDGWVADTIAATIDDGVIA